mmetsp:Transcript_649/g.1553  ORF Transcript_649/g.1553 Transcript_649/m.1553 type:complete len:609 (+) Transcript_649:48-1874(+)
MMVVPVSSPGQMSIFEDLATGPAEEQSWTEEQGRALKELDNWPRRTLEFGDSENTAPTQTKVDPTTPTAAKATVWTHLREIERLKEQLAVEERQRLQAEAQANGTRSARKNVNEARTQLQNKDRMIAELQRRCVEMDALHREEQRRIIAGKEQAVIAVQRELEDLRAKHRERATLIAELAEAAEEVEHLRNDNAVLRLRLLADDSENCGAQAARSGAEAPAPPAETEVKAESLVADFEARMGQSVESIQAELRKLSERTSRNKADVHELFVLRKECALQHFRSMASEAVHNAVVKALLEGALTGQRSSPSIATSGSCSQAEGCSETRVAEAEQRAAEAELQAVEAEQQAAELGYGLGAAEERTAEAERKALAAERKAAEVEQRLEEAELLVEVERKAAEELRVANQELGFIVKKLQEEVPDIDLQEEGLEPRQLRLQNRELVLTIRQLQQDCEFLQGERKSLAETSAIWEEKLGRAEGREAKLAGHTNHKQKIRYTMKLKEENVTLREDLKKARRRCLQLETGKRGDGAPDTLAALLVGGSSSRGRGREEEENVMERVMVDVQHLQALIRQAVCVGEPGTVGCAADLDTTALLRRLRGIVTRQLRPPS